MIVQESSISSGAGSVQARAGFAATAREAAKDLISGIAASVVPVANMVSFGALLFHDNLSAGISVAVWAMLIGSCIGGAWIALKTSLPPMACGMDSPTVAVLAVLSTIAGPQMLAAGASYGAVVQSLMLIFLAATVVSGTLQFAVGALRWGAYLRFVPYSVVAGFLAAAGYLLIAGGVRLIAGRAHAMAALFTDWHPTELLKLGSAGASLLVLVAVRRWIMRPFAIPAALVAMWALTTAGLHLLGLSGQADGWYLSVPEVSSWSVLGALRSSALSWSMVPSITPEIMVVAVVSFISLIAKITTIEVARNASGVLDRELRSHGVANLIAAPFGGLATSVQPGTSLLLEYAGAASRVSGVVCAAVFGLIGIANLNLPSMIPISLIGALIFYLGLNFLTDALGRLARQRAWLDLALAFVIMAVCIRFGYLVGVLVGLLCSCVIFVVSYARIGVVRGHATRTNFSSYVERPPAASRYLRENGDAIRLYWFSGYVFFGSSEGVFERIRNDLEAPNARRSRYVIVDFAAVSGVDSSALFSITKLHRLSEQYGTTLVYAALLPEIRSRLESRGLLGGTTPHRAFKDLNAALVWCEDEMLATANIGENDGNAGFNQWLQLQFGPDINTTEFTSYLERREIPAAQVIYRQGEPADTIDLVASGALAVDILTGDGQIVHVRRMTTHTVIGEMGFFRRTIRSTSVSADEPATLFTLSRASFEKMRRERPELASAFNEFVIRILAERVEFRDRTVSALNRPQ